MDLVIYVMAIFGLSFLVKESDGPWGIISWFRNKLMTNKYIGVFFYKLFSCYFCVGCHAGYAVYMLHTPFRIWSISDFILWVLAGGAISFVMNLFVEKLSVHE